MSNWPGNLIRKTPVTPAGPFQNGAAPGVWSLSEASYWTKQGLWPLAGNEQLVVEDVFSTWLYTGNGSTQTITNGIDLAGKGGLVWNKSRSNADYHWLEDSARGFNNNLFTNATDAQFNYSLVSPTSSGFNILGSLSDFNANGKTYTSWTFREAPNFFDAVTWTGNGANRNIAHNLGSVPGMIIVKRTDTAADWQVYHRSNANTQYQVLNTTAAVATGTTRWNSTTPTATEFTVGTDATVNASGGTYVAYLYAHNTASDGIIQCGSYTVPAGATSYDVNIGWEPQWMLVKRANGGGGWTMLDNMRGWPQSPSVGAGLSANTSDAEFNTAKPDITSTGFSVNDFSSFGTPGNTFIYMAIRRGPMRTPTLGTSVFSPVAAVSGAQTTGFPIDLQLERLLGVSSTLVHDRLRGVVTTDANLPSPALYTNATYEEITGNNASKNWGNTGFTVPSVFSGGSGIYWNFRRAPGFFDEVCYTGTGSGGTNTINHNLGVAPELIIIKSRSNALAWGVMHTFAPTTLSINYLNTNAAAFSSDYATILWATGQPTATQFALYGASTTVNTSGATYVAYLFASAPGVSKVGSYTGNGSSQTINCGFAAGARFVLIKRTDSTGGWLVWDSARGIVAGNDPYVALNSNAAQVTSDDSVDTDNTGFIVNQVAASDVNVNGATYIFLAIA